MKDLDAIAEDIINQLDIYAREYDSYQHGLPIYGKEGEDMKQIVINILKEKS